MIRKSLDAIDASEGALPTFIVIGAMKSGTTSLAQYLGAHPDVFMTTPKEPHFFNREENYQRGIEWYRSLFAGSGAARARGEATPGYTRAQLFPEVPARIAGVVPEARLIYLLRDPIERIRSQYAFHARRSDERRPINQGVVEDPRYVDTSRYGFQLGLYLEYFDREQILVLWSEDLHDRRAETMARAFEFIGVDPDLGAHHLVLQRQFNQTASWRGPTRWTHALRQIARRTPLALLPGATKRRMYKRFGRRYKQSETALTPEVEAHLWSQLKPDSEALGVLIGETPPWMEWRATR